MGARGPKPTPKEILAMRGSRAGKPGYEPQPERTLPDPPAWLDNLARACWDDTLPQLEAMGVATRIDGNALARYCTLWSRWRQAEQFLAQHGSGYAMTGKNGDTYFAQYPEVAIAANLSTQLTKIEAEFGMTPSSRSRIIVAPSATPQNNILDFLSQPKG